MLFPLLKSQFLTSDTEMHSPATAQQTHGEKDVMLNLSPVSEDQLLHKGLFPL